jgi:hypothetical protein
MKSKYKNSLNVILSDWKNKLNCENISVFSRIKQNDSYSYLAIRYYFLISYYADSSKNSSSSSRILKIGAILSSTEKPNRSALC